MSVAIVFGGQGSEEPAMGLAFVDDPIITIASEVTGCDVPRLMARGGKALADTAVLQPVLAAVGLASAYALERRGIACSCVAGHSLGELVAACFAARIEPREAIALAAFRGQLMAEAAALRPGAMAALRARPEELVLPAGVVIAAHNAPDETVISGETDLVGATLARVGGTALRVAGAWHSEHMRSAVEPLRARLAARLPGVAPIPLVPSEHRPLHDRLAEALVRPVHFVAVLEALEARRIRHVIVAAPSRVVRSLVRRTLRARVEVHGADDLASIDRVAAGLET